MGKLAEQLKLKLFTLPLHRMRWMFRPEARIIRQRGVASKKNAADSVFFFSTHKCASTFLNSLIKDLAARAGMTHADIETYLVDDPARRDELYADGRFTDALLKSKGYYFGIFRYAFKRLPAHPDRKVVLVLRDPRDVLTSQYFSIAYSHPVYTQRFLKKREHALNVGIDRHVLDMSDRFLNTYSDYIKSYLGKKNVLFVRYEDLISDFRKNLGKILDLIDHPQKEAALNHWLALDPFKLAPEDAQRHKRKMTPGDHKEKLKPETIAELDRKFAAVLAALGYK